MKTHADQTALVLPHKFDGLQAWLTASLGYQSLHIVGFMLMGGGAIQENWALDVEYYEGCESDVVKAAWVLRTDSESTLSTSHTRAQEYALLEVVSAAQVMAPQPVVMCEDTTVIGSAFYVMQRAAGTAMAREIVRSPERQQDGQPLAAELGRQLARIHRIIPGQSTSVDQHLAFLSVPETDPVTSRLQRYRKDLDQLPVPVPVLEYALNWLASHAPQNQSVCLCHCDYRTGNYMVDNSELQAILDWEFASWSDPYEDLGWFTARCWRFGMTRLEAGGIAGLDSFLSAYETESGSLICKVTLQYWQMMAEVRWAVIALQQAHRHYSGQQVSLELALTDRLVPEMELNLLQGMGGSLDMHDEAAGNAVIRNHHEPVSSAEHVHVSTHGMANTFLSRQHGLITAALAELESNVIPGADKRLSYSCAMIRRSLQILKREMQSSTGAAEQVLLERVYGHGTQLTLATLAKDIRLRDTPIDDASLKQALLHFTKQRLMIDNPAALAEPPEPTAV